MKPEKQKEYSRKYYQTHRDAQREYSRQYYLANRNAILAHQRRVYAAKRKAKNAKPPELETQTASGKHEN
jgi:hypothetical protein